MIRRPASSLSLRSPTPTHFSRRPGTPSFHQQHNNSSSPSLASGNLQSSNYSGSIKVSVRVKPPNAASSKQPSNTKVAVSPDGSITTINDQWSIDSIRNAISTKEVGEFVFDHVYHGPISNSHIFDRSVHDLVDQVMSGYNGTVFAYGMTGSGKTFSMQGNSSNPGIIPLSANTIFDYIRSPTTNTENRLFTVKVSYLEIYNEHLNDLLSPGTPSEDIKLRDDPIRGGVRAMGLKEVVVSSPEELLDCIHAGDAIRRTEGTEFNSKSSRSHAVVQIFVESTASASGPNPGGPARSSLLYLCDLAGSERAASQTERRKEGAYINKSLLTLGTVISRLSAVSTSASNVSAGHIPYRDSKLTRLLQPALSGKSLVSILCTIDVNTGAAIPGGSGSGVAGSTSSAASSFSQPAIGPLTSANSTTSTYVETISTLRFAARAKNIMVNVKRNEDLGADSRVIEKLVGQIEAQKIEIARLKAAAANGGEGLPRANSTSSEITLNHYVSQIAQLEAENRILHERVEHLTRLCDDNKLEELILLNDFQDSGADTPASVSTTGSPKLSSEDGTSDSATQRQIDEYKSYIAHLEKQLYQAELQKSMSTYTASFPSSPTAPQPNSNGGVSSGPLSKPPSAAPPISPLSATFDIGNTTITHGSPSPAPSVTALPMVSSTSGASSSSMATSATAASSYYYNELLTELRDEIEELRESNADKDRIIAALRSINKRKENISALSAGIFAALPASASSSPSVSAPTTASSSLYQSHYATAGSSKFYLPPTDENLELGAAAKDGSNSRPPSPLKNYINKPPTRFISSTASRAAAGNNTARIREPTDSEINSARSSTVSILQEE